MKLLIVDDSSIIRKAIQSYLADLALDIVGEAADGEQAMKLFRETRPALVTLDITMPEMDGMVCLEEMLKIDPDVRIVVITAMTDKVTAVKALNKGARGFLGKPFTKEQLKASIEKVL